MAPVTLEKAPKRPPSGRLHLGYRLLTGAPGRAISFVIDLAAVLIALIRHASGRVASIVSDLLRRNR